MLLFGNENTTKISSSTTQPNRFSFSISYIICSFLSQLERTNKGCNQRLFLLDSQYLLSRLSILGSLSRQRLWQEARSLYWPKSELDSKVGQANLSLLREDLCLLNPSSQAQLTFGALRFASLKLVWMRFDSMCSAFLWSGSPNDSSKAKVVWKEVCTPLAEGGLGVRAISEVTTVFSLKLIWCLLNESNSLWVDWVRKYILRQESF